MTDFREIRQLFGITENGGFSALEISMFKTVCKSIPNVLIEYYGQLGKVQELNQTQDRLLEPQNIELSKNKDFIIFYVENQRACVWGIKRVDLQIDDPPVYMSYDESKWNRETHCLTDFLKAMANLQAVFALPFASDEFAYINEQELRIIEENFKKRDFSLSSWIGVSFFGNSVNEVIAIQKNDPHYDLIYASNNEKEFLEMDTFLGTLGA